MTAIAEFIEFVKKHDGIGDKDQLIALVIHKFKLIKDRKVYYCDSFAVRFSYSSGKGFSNTVLSLSNLQKFDRIPFIVCLVTGPSNRLLLANTTFLAKISHSSHELSLLNIKGSFNGSDIMKSFNGLDNDHDNIYRLFAVHAEIGFEGNLLRLVEATNSINPSGSKYEISDDGTVNLLNAVQRAKDFCESDNYRTLHDDLNERVERYHNEILIASHIENVNLRGRIIEYLIAGDDEVVKRNIVREIHAEYTVFPKFKTDNTLGDYRRVFDEILTETDVKTKVLMLNSNPKAYNIDKFIEYHSSVNTVFLFFFVGINAESIVNKVLVSVFQKDLLESTIILKHWAGRNSRGVTQFEGSTIHRLINQPNNDIDIESANRFMTNLVNL